MMPETPPLAPKIHALDDSLSELVQGIDILDAIAPLNYHEQRELFFANNYTKNPSFLYQRHTIDTFAKKRALFNIPVEDLIDEDLTELYVDTIESYVDKIDQYQSIGTPDFIYDSLRYYGEPTDKDLRNANFILHLPDDDTDEQCVRAPQIQSLLEAFAEREGYQYEIQLVDNMIANALVSGIKVKINAAAEISETEAHALAHHELGVHLVTTLNARQQPLKILKMGCPVNTMTQEGLAILSEYLAGHMTLSRLKVLALRVLAVKSMIDEKDFKRTFLLLKDQYNIPDVKAFTITARVYRGGGITKDYLYLQGFHKILNAYEEQNNFDLLMSGKVSLDYLPQVSRLIEKGYLVGPKYITPSVKNPIENDSIKRFIAFAIK